MLEVLRALDAWLDQTTMYRLLLYYLAGLLLVAMGLGQLGHLRFTALAILFSATVLLAACWAFNKLFAAIFKAPTNYESSLITGLILALIISPVSGFHGLGLLIIAPLLAMASKYVLAINRKHIFNPAAIAVVLTALGPRQAASWWVGTAVLLPFVIAGGLLLLRKLRRFQMVLLFEATALVASVVATLLTHGQLAINLKEIILDSGLFFMAYVMFTEPMTSPPTFRKQCWYALLVGVLFPPQIHLFGLYSTPELALVAGNIFAYLISPKTKLFPAFKEKLAIGPNVLDFVFSPGQPLAYAPGQYMEWTLPHKQPDARGNRRYFTLASSPTESEVRIGVKFEEQGSSFKKALLAMTRQTRLVAAQIAGDFVLPEDKTQKLAFIAGGIGVTPFRSMIKYLTDTGEQRDVTLLYSARAVEELAYREVFEAGRRKFGLKTVYAITGTGATLPDAGYHLGYITADLIRAEIPDYRERLFYLSGTHAMVTAMQATLHDLGVHAGHIKTDFFPGYA